MPKLVENVLVDGKVYLAGEDLTTAQAKTVTANVFEDAAETNNVKTRTGGKPRTRANTKAAKTPSDTAKE